MTKRIKIKLCEKCKKPFAAHHGNQRVCSRCTQQRLRAEKRAWYHRHKPLGCGKRGRRAWISKCIPGLTFEFTGGKWWWKHADGLTNGPFDTLGKARKDAQKAF